VSQSGITLGRRQGELDADFRSLGVASGAPLLRLADTDVQPTLTFDINEEAQADESTRNTPIPKAIYTLSQLEPFVDAYFSLYHMSYPIVHEATFRAQVSFSNLLPSSCNH
jgi:transcriptional regulatory protein GAL4